jgi:hypothetical protein
VLRGRKVWFVFLGLLLGTPVFGSPPVAGDVAEDFWLAVKKDNSWEKFPPSRDVEVASFQARSEFDHHPHLLKAWVPSFLNYISTIFERPFDGSIEVFHWFHLFLLPICWALILVLAFKLWIWKPALRHHRSRFFFLRSPLVVLGLIFTLIGFGFVSGDWYFVAYLFLCLALIYSRDLRPVLVATVIAAVFISLQPFGQILKESFSDLSAIEALSLGRTRINYSSSSLDLLSPVEKTLWADMNGDLSAAKTWLNEAPPSMEKSVLTINLDATNKTPHQMLSAYEKLAGEFPGQSLIQFNLSQLYTRAQNLVKADQSRLKMSPELYNFYQDRSLKMGKIILNPVAEVTWGHWQKALDLRKNQMLSALGFSPNEKTRATKSILYFLSIWVLFILSHRQRKKAMGLCKQTGEMTPSPSVDLSMLYQSQMTKADTTSMVNLRQQVDQMVRAYQQLQRKRFALWKIIIPEASSVIYDDHWVSSVLKLSALFSLAWIALSFSVRQEWIASLDFRWAPHEFSWPFFALAILTWVLLFLENQRQGSS